MTKLSRCRLAPSVWLRWQYRLPLLRVPVSFAALYIVGLSYNIGS